MLDIMRNNKSDIACVSARDIWEISLPSPQFFCENIKTALKNC